MKTTTLLARMAEYLAERIDEGIESPIEYCVVSGAEEALRRAAVIGRYNEVNLKAVLKLAEFDLAAFENRVINVAPAVLEIGPFRYRRELSPVDADQWRQLKNRVRHLRSVLRHAERAEWAGR